MLDTIASGSIEIPLSVCLSGSDDSIIPRNLYCFGGYFGIDSFTLFGRSHSFMGPAGPLRRSTSTGDVALC